MNRLRTTVIAGTAAVLAAGAVTLPAEAARRGGHGPGGGAGGPAGSNLTLTAAATAVLDQADADLDAIGGAWTRRTDDDRIAVSLRHGKQSSNASGFELATDAESTTWTTFALDRTTGAVTATVDGAAGVSVFTSTASTTSGTKRSTRTLVLTEAAATALDRVVGADEFDAGDTFGTLGK